MAIKKGSDPKQEMISQIDIDWDWIKLEEISTYLWLDKENWLKPTDENLKKIKDAIVDKLSDPKKKAIFLSILGDMSRDEAWLEKDHKDEINNLKEIIKMELWKLAWEVQSIEIVERKYLEEWIDKYSWEDIHKLMREHLRNFSELPIIAEKLSDSMEVNWYSAFSVIQKQYSLHKQGKAKQIEQLKDEDWIDKDALKDLWNERWYNSDGIFWYQELEDIQFLWAMYFMDETFRKEIDYLMELNVMWVSMYDIWNTQRLLEKTWPENIFDILCDYNCDWEIDDDDESFISWLQLKDAINDILIDESFGKTPQEREKKLIANIWYFLNRMDGSVKIKTKQDLYNEFKLCPELRNKFIKELHLLWQKTWDVDYLLRYGEKWVSKWMDVRKQSLKYLEKDENYQRIYKKIQKKQEDLFNKLKIDMKKEIDEWRITDQWTIDLYNAMFVKKNSSFWDYINFEWAALAVNLSMAMSTFSSQEIDFFVDHEIKFQLWFANGLPMIWVTWKVFDKEFGNNKQYNLFWVWWVMLFVPFFILGSRYKMNIDEIERSWLSWYNTKMGNLWSYTNISPIWAWFTVSYDKNTIEWINQKRDQFRAIMWELFSMGESDIQSKDWVLKKLRENLVNQNTNQEHKLDMKYIEDIIKNVWMQLDIVWFDNLSMDQKVEVLHLIKYSYINIWTERVLNDNEWFKFSWVWASFQILFEFIPIILFWASFEYVQADYELDKDKAIIDSLWINSWIWLEKVELEWEKHSKKKRMDFAKKLESKINVSWLTVKEDNWMIKITPPEWENIIDMLNVYVELWSGYATNVHYDWKSLILWDMHISYINQRLDEDEIHYLILWPWWSKWKQKLTKDILETFQYSLSDWQELTVWQEAFATQIEWSSPLEWMVSHKNNDVETYINTHISDFFGMAMSKTEYVKVYKKYLNTELSREDAIKLLHLESKTPSDQQDVLNWWGYVEWKWFKDSYFLVGWALSQMMQSINRWGKLVNTWKPDPKFANSVVLNELEKTLQAYSVAKWSGDMAQKDIFYNKLAYLVSQINDGIMTDWVTEKKSTLEGSSDKMIKQWNDYIDQIFSEWVLSQDKKKISVHWWKYTFSKEWLKKMVRALFDEKFRKEYTGKELSFDETWNWKRISWKIISTDTTLANKSYSYHDVFSILVWYKSDQWIKTNPAKLLFAMLQPNSALMNDGFMWVKWTNRVDWFKNLVNQENMKWTKLDLNTLIWYRTQLQNDINSRNKSWWEFVQNSKIISFTWSYKTDSKWNSIVRQFDTMPPWVTNIVDGKTLNITDDSTKAWIIERIQNTPYYKNMRDSLHLDDEQFALLLTTWRAKAKVDWGFVDLNLDREFVFFFYGRCSNESLWIIMNKLTVWWWTWSSWWKWGNVVYDLSMSADGRVTWNIIKWDRNFFTLWLPIKLENGVEVWDDNWWWWTTTSWWWSSQIWWWSSSWTGSWWSSNSSGGWSR